MDTLMNQSYEGLSEKAMQLKSAQFHYEVPNLSSMLYEFTNREKERI